MTAADPSPPVRGRRGRRPGGSTTRQAVLDAARARFAADGYDGTTIRAVAMDAAVDPSQVMQFFGSKEELFAAVMAVPASALERFDTAFGGPDERLGERVARAFLDAWEGVAEESEPLMAMLRGAVVHEQAAGRLRDFLRARLTAGSRGHPAPDAALRAGLAAAMLVGVVTSRRIIGVPVVADAEIDELVAVLAPAIQDVLVPGGRSRPSVGPETG